MSLEKPVGDEEESEFGHFLTDESEPLPEEAADGERARPGTASNSLLRGSTGPAKTQATSFSELVTASARSFFRLWFSICLIRSRVTLNVRPTSSSVRGCWPSRP